MVTVKTMEKHAETEPQRRIVGQAIGRNPLASVVACIKPEHVDDLDIEISLTENYLSGLRAMKTVANVALGRTQELKIPSPEPVVTVKAAEPKPEPVPEPAKKDTKLKSPTINVGFDKPSLTDFIRSVFVVDLETPVSEIITKIKADGRFQASDGTIRGLAYNLRSRIRTGKSTIEKKRPYRAKAEEPKPVVSDKPSEPPKALGKVELQLLGLRQTVAEFVFKRGLVKNADIAGNCEINLDEVQAFMQHPWFEEHMGQWRLTSVGKNEGLSWS